MKTVIAVIIFTIFLSSCTDNAAQEIITKSGTFKIPGKRIFSAKSPFPNYKGDEYSPLILVWNGKEIKKEIPEYPIHDDVELTGIVLFDSKLENIYFNYAYMFDGHYTGGAFDYDASLNLYRVYDRFHSDDKDKFVLLREKPSVKNKPLENVFDIYVGSCLYLLTRKDFSCDAYFEIEKGKHVAMVDIGSISAFEYLDQFKNYIRDDLLSYKTK